MITIGRGTAIEHIYLEQGVAGSKAAARAREHAGAAVPVETVDNREGIPKQHRNEHTLFIARTPGGAFKRCPGSRGHLCCNYLTLDLYAGCTLGCTYCIMKSYLSFSPLTVYADLEASMAKIREVALGNPGVLLRVGTGEVGDSLLYDPVFRLSEELIRALADIPNLRLELKTKSVEVDHLLDIEKKGKTVIGFSLNPESIIREEEPWATSLEERLDAARRASDAGYAVAFHFDPIIRVEEWERSYLEVVDRLEPFRSREVAWVSLGTMRFTKGLRDRIEERPYIFDEFFPSADGKLRYLQGSRVAVYRALRERIAATLDAPVYLCMESEAVWKRAMGGVPESLDEVRGLFRWPSGMPKLIR